MVYINDDIENEQKLLFTHELGCVNTQQASKSADRLWQWCAEPRDIHWRWDNSLYGEDETWVKRIRDHLSPFLIRKFDSAFGCLLVQLTILSNNLSPCNVLATSTESEISSSEFVFVYNRLWKPSTRKVCKNLSRGFSEKNKFERKFNGFCWLASKRFWRCPS